MDRAVLALAVLGSIVGLAAGAAIHALGRGRGRAVVDGLVLGAIPLLIAVRVVPHVYEELGRVALAFVALGFVTVALGDRHGHEGGERVSRAVLVPTLFVHALADGAALALAAAGSASDSHDTHDTHGATDAHAGQLHAHEIEPHGHDGHAHEEHAHSHGSLVARGRWVLLLAIVAHRLPEGLLVCAALVPTLGWRKTLPRLGGIAGATVVGAVAGRSLLSIVPDRWLDAVVAFGVGAMLRLAVHTHEREERTPRERFAAGVAFIVGVTSVLMIPDPDSVLARAQPTELSVARSLAPLFIETAPAMALAMLAMLAARSWGVHRSWLTSALFSSGRGEGAAWLSRARSAQSGERLALWGVFAVTALGLDALALSLGWFGFVGASVRWLFAAVLPLVWLGARPPPLESERHEVAVEGAGPSSSLRALAANAGWYAAGLLGGAVAEAALSSSALQGFTGPKATLLAALFAMVVGLPITAAVPFAAVAVHKGAGVDVAFAWLWASAVRAALSSATWLKWLRMAPISMSVRAAAGVASIVLVASVARGSGAVRFPELHPRLAHAHVPFEWVCVAISSAVLLGILLRLGPRAVFESMSESRSGERSHSEHSH